ncbi:MAG: tetratricopeptide repeat protein [Candidatus Omnitrophica bacterium]|nr:tetratricopeptide repeat protein [Candidatus Omnitrophota bacterium]
MKKLVLLSMVFVLSLAGLSQAQEQAATTASVSAPVAVAKPSAYNFGDFRSTTLTTKAWKALADKNLDAVLVYTNKCLELYAEKARVMQAGLKEYPAGDEQKVFSFWALNDVATCVFIQGEAYRQAGKMEDAKQAFNRVVSDFSFGQAYDPANKAFWKPADAAKEKLDMIKKGLNLDFGDMSSSAISTKAWEALAKKDLDGVQAYVNKNIELYGARAREMQASLKEFPWESQEKIYSFWALNDVGTSLFILGQAYRNAGKNVEALTIFKQLAKEYGYSQCWDTQGWFWKPAEAAEQQIIELEAVK